VAVSPELVEERLQPEVVQALRRPHLSVLATAGLDGYPATTLVSWIYGHDETRLVIALDRRGLAYANVLENANCALEVLVKGFVATLRGRATILRDQLAHAPFPCAAVLFELEEIREHGVAGVAINPATYHFEATNGRYAETEAAIIAELSAISSRSAAAAAIRQATAVD